MSFSDYLEAELLDHVFKRDAGYTQPSNLYIALSTANPGDDGAGLAEPSGNGYARQLCNAWDRTANQVSNTSDVTFDEATGSWGTITYFAVFDALSGGNMLGSGAVSPSQAVVSGNTVVFKANQLTVDLD